MREAILNHLVSEEAGGFVKLIETFEKKTVYDRTADISSVYGIFTFGVLEPDDPRLAKAFENTVARIRVDGGIGRYEADKYFRTSDKSNPWFITTLWYAQYLIAGAKSAEDLAPVRDIFEWVAAHAQPSGVLSEQISAADGGQRSVAPLAWSHAAYVDTVLDYLDKLEALGVCAACNPAP
jgi:GH15 family glucan-1,4-alpha-glucosidase